MQNFFKYAIIAIIITACNNADVGDKKDEATNTVYMDYKIWGEEGKENVNVLLQFREGIEGNSLVLEEPAKVELDGEKLQPDSAGFTGAFYEVQKPVQEFAGKHQIVFTDINNRKFVEEFEFLPFTLENEFPQKLKRSEWKFQLKGLAPTEVLRVIVTDTSFNSPDINELLTVSNGELNISKDLLANVVNGPVTLDIFKEIERELKNGKDKGNLSITYGLRRETNLIN